MKRIVSVAIFAAACACFSEPGQDIATDSVTGSGAGSTTGIVGGSGPSDAATSTHPTSSSSSTATVSTRAGSETNNDNSFGARSTLTVGDKSYEIFRLDVLSKGGGWPRGEAAVLAAGAA